jgi:hypothetical protein
MPSGSSRPSAPAIPSSARSAADAADGPTSFSWRSWPIVDEAAQSWSLIAALTAIAMLCGWLAGDSLAGVLVAIVLAYSVRQLWLPATYKINPSGIERRFLGRSQRIPLPTFAASAINSNGVAFNSNGSRSGSKCLFVPWGSHRDAILAALAATDPKSDQTRAALDSAGRSLATKQAT